MGFNLLQVFFLKKIIVEVLPAEEFETSLRYLHQDFVVGFVKILFVDYVVQLTYQQILLSIYIFFNDNILINKYKHFFRIFNRCLHINNPPNWE